MGVDDLTNAKTALEAEMKKDELALQKLKDELEAANNVGKELDDVQALMDKLIGGGRSNRGKRQAATSCGEIANLVDEMEKETDTVKKLAIIRRITSSTVTGCSDEDKKALQEKKAKIAAIKQQNKEKLEAIKKQKEELANKITANKNKINAINAQINALNNKTTKPMGGTTTSKVTGPIEETPVPMPTGKSSTADSGKITTAGVTSSGETPVPMPSGKPTTPSVKPGTGETPQPMTTGGETSRPIATGPTGGPTPSGETPRIMVTGWTSDGETPIPLKPKSKQMHFANWMAVN